MALDEQPQATAILVQAMARRILQSFQSIYLLIKYFARGHFHSSSVLSIRYYLYYHSSCVFNVNLGAYPYFSGARERFSFN